MTSRTLCLVFSAVCLFAGMAITDHAGAAGKPQGTSPSAVSGSKADALLPASHALKAVEGQISGQVLHMHLVHPPKGRTPYYVFTIVDAASNEVKDAYVNAKTGKLRQIIEHPEEESPGP